MSETDSQNIPQGGMGHGPAHTMPAPSAPAPVNANKPAAPAQPMPARPVAPQPVPAPAQSGPLPPVAPGMQPAAAAAALPVAAPGPDYHPPIAGGVNPANPMAKPPKKSNGLLIFGIIVCLIAAVVLIAALFYVTTREQSEPLQVDPPSTATMQAAFDEAKIEPSGLSSYAYINTDGLDDPQINDVKAGSVTYGSDNRSATCDATATASWENDSVSVEQTVQIPFTFNTSSQEWQAGTASGRASDLKVTPVGPADLEKLQEALPDLLRSYDAEIAKQFESPEIAATANLDAEGGEVTFALDQDNDGNHVQTNVTVQVTWEDGKGWVATIEQIGEIVGGEQPAEGEGEGEGEGGDATASGGETSPSNPSSSGGSGDGAQMLLNCVTGDLVEVPGVIEYRDNRVLLRSDYTIRVVLDGRSYVTNYFELTANTFVVTNGAHVSVVGEISATGGLEQAPLMLNLDYEG